MNDITQRLRQYCTDWNGEPLSDETTPMDGLHCITLREAADEIDRLHTGIKRLSDEEELCAETTGDDPFSMVYLASKINDRESDITQLSTLYSNAIARAEKAEEALRVERERCAKIAEDYASGVAVETGMIRAGHAVAAAIRTPPPVRETP